MRIRGHQCFIGGFGFDTRLLGVTASLAFSFAAPDCALMADLDFLSEPSKDLYKASSRFDTDGRTLVKAFTKSFIVTRAGPWFY